jgi:hypothetical protein
MDAEIAVAIFGGLILSFGLGYLLGWLRGHDIGTSLAHAVCNDLLRSALRDPP